MIFWGWRPSSPIRFRPKSVPQPETFSITQRSKQLSLWRVAAPCQLNLPPSGRHPMMFHIATRQILLCQSKSNPTCLRTIHGCLQRSSRARYSWWQTKKKTRVPRYPRTPRAPPFSTVVCRARRKTSCKMRPASLRSRSRQTTTLGKLYVTWTYLIHNSQTSSKASSNISRPTRQLLGPTRTSRTSGKR